jgi:hypothetical protein
MSNGFKNRSWIDLAVTRTCASTYRLYMCIIVSTRVCVLPNYELVPHSFLIGLGKIK